MNSGFAASSYNVIYKWSTSTISSCPSSTSGWTSKSISVSGTSGSGTVTLNNLTGNGKLYVCPHPSSGITDSSGNSATYNNTSISSANMYLKDSCLTIDNSSTCYTSGTTVNTTGSASCNYLTNDKPSTCSIKNNMTNQTIKTLNVSGNCTLSSSYTGSFASYSCPLSFTMPSSDVSISCTCSISSGGSSVY